MTEEAFIDFICCGEEMDVVGLEYGNGWICRKCGKEIYDIASVKMSGNYESWLFSEPNKE